MLFDLKTLILGLASVGVYAALLLLMAPESDAKATGLLHHLGEMGRREIARTRATCLRTLVAAGGAGLITAGTVAFKISLFHDTFTWLAAYGLKALNFVASFLLIQLAGFRLATKQSPLFGAALGSRWSETAPGAGRERFREEVGWGLRTQALSALGNLFCVIPAAFAFHWLYLIWAGAPFLDAKSAVSTLQSLHPWESATLAYAALTGGLLWLCTLWGGKLASRFGTFSGKLATVFFNILLGLGLAFVPMLGSWLAIPLDVRHFTLSGGTAAIAVASLGLSASVDAGLIPAFSGVLWIGILNFSVSFALAFLASWLNSRSARSEAWLAPQATARPAFASP